MMALLIALFVLWTLVAYVMALIRIMNAGMDYDIGRSEKPARARRLLVAFLDLPFAPLTMAIRVAEFIHRLRGEARTVDVVDEAERVASERE